jgi:hypothetical protein
MRFLGEWADRGTNRVQKQLGGVASRRQPWPRTTNRREAIKAFLDKYGIGERRATAALVKSSIGNGESLYDHRRFRSI